MHEIIGSCVGTGCLSHRTYHERPDRSPFASLHTQLCLYTHTRVRLPLRYFAQMIPLALSSKQHLVPVLLHPLSVYGIRTAVCIGVAISVWHNTIPLSETELAATIQPQRDTATCSRGSRIILAANSVKRVKRIGITNYKRTPVIAALEKSRRLGTYALGAGTG